MAENELLAQAVAEGMNLKASGVSIPQDAPERTQEAGPPAAVNDNDPAQAALMADLKAFASSPQGQALSQSQEKPVEPVQERPDGMQALLVDLQKYTSQQPGGPEAPSPAQEIEQQPKR